MKPCSINMMLQEIFRNPLAQKAGSWFTQVKGISWMMGWDPCQLYDLTVNSSELIISAIQTLKDNLMTKDGSVLKTMNRYKSYIEIIPSPGTCKNWEGFTRIARNLNLGLLNSSRWYYLGNDKVLDLPVDSV